jgi:hypothetical protein
MRFGALRPANLPGCLSAEPVISAFAFGVLCAGIVTCCFCSSIEVEMRVEKTGRGVRGQARKVFDCPPRLLNVIVGNYRPANGNPIGHPSIPIV